MLPNKLPTPILITGAPRSGTSMVAGAINLSGAFGGDMSGPNKNNRKGMFENFEIRNKIVKPYLRDLGLDPLGQYPLPDPEKIPIPNDWKQRVEQVIIAQGYKQGPWMYKGAKMCLIHPIWRYAFPDAKWIIVRRAAKDIINSCIRTGFMRAFSREQFRKAVGVDNEADGWAWWLERHLERFREMMDAGCNIKVVYPERIVRGDYTQIYETIEWLGLEWKSKIVAQFIDPKLWHSRNKGAH